MNSTRTTGPVTRRTALAGLALTGVGLALASRSPEAAVAQDSAAQHPMVGTWLVAGRLGPSMTIVSPDGAWQDSGVATEAGPNGVAYNSDTVGRWEPISDRGIHFTAIQVQADANGVYLGSLTIDGHPVASEDGLTFSDSDPETMLTIRDAAHNVIQIITPYQAGDGSVPPRTGVRIEVGAPGFPEGPPDAATPAT